MTAAEVIAFAGSIGMPLQPWQVQVIEAVYDGRMLLPQGHRRSAGMRQLQELAERHAGHLARLRLLDEWRIAYGRGGQPVVAASPAPQLSLPPALQLRVRLNTCAAIA
ncbi:hypothetical protein [Microbacterium sp. Bi128]|uniref:hypothetical protein n=1 Tax=Microbacterium sp. Bi128 TaxID=2821115 RepID=UPI001D7DA410|nr:hypothetical protein [Microbacterium sp. Bi128]CAH0258307.1 hypothetical protein SRABI128_03080 [Microbacterium sp. Bi128]